jgi:predicted MFS family arabinose efflux permease
VLLAAACGLSVANIYYAQPVLRLLGETFHRSEGSLTLIVTVTQIGYAIGLFLMLPLGDLFETRRLTPLMLCVTAAALAVAGSASSVGVFMVASVVIGVTAVVAQILVPFSAHLAPEESRGRVVGRVMSGLLLGIMLARTVSSFIAAALGWRAIFFISGGLLLVMAVTLWRLLPARKPDHSAGYLSLMTSVGSLVRELPVLRRRSVCQAALFICFTAYWTEIAFELMNRHGFSQAQVGLFALVGATGVTVAPVAGRIADRGGGRWGSGVALAIGVVAMIIAWRGADHVVLLGLAAVLLDVSQVGHQLFSQREIYELRPNARARITTVFMGTVFLAGAAGSAVAGVLQSHSGWSGVTVFAACSAAVGLLVWAGSTVLGVMRSAPAADRPAPVADRS